MMEIFYEYFSLGKSQQLNMGRKKIGRFAYDVNALIGSGQYGKVYLAEEIETKEKIAVKVINKKQISADQYTKEAMCREINIMKIVRSPNIINYLQTLQTKNNIYIFQELAKDGSLRQLLKKHGPLNENTTVKYCVQMLRGLCELAKHGIIHRDLKPDNILVKGDTLKLADFGFSRYSDSMSYLKSLVGSPIYMAPQVLNRDVHEFYSYKCDIWSFGVICYEMIMGKIPWKIQSKTHTEFYYTVESQSKAGIEFNPEIPISKDLKNLIRGCLQFNQSDRYGWVTILSHALFKDKLFQGQSLENQQRIRQAFALTKLRMSIHTNNINFSKILNNLQTQVKFQDFYILLLAIDNELSQKQIMSIFNSISKNKKITTQKDIINHFKSNWFNLNGKKFSDIIQSDQISSEEIDKKLQKIYTCIHNKHINLEELFKKHDTDNCNTLQFEQFSNMFLEISPELEKKELQLIFQIFAANHMVYKDSCIQKLYKMAMVPHIKDQNIHENLRKIRKKQSKESNRRSS